MTTKFSLQLPTLRSSHPNSPHRNVSGPPAGERKWLQVPRSQKRPPPPDQHCRGLRVAGLASVPVPRAWCRAWPMGHPSVVTVSVRSQTSEARAVLGGASRGVSSIRRLRLLTSVGGFLLTRLCGPLRTPGTASPALHGGEP